MSRESPVISPLFSRSRGNYTPELRGRCRSAFPPRCPGGRALSAVRIVFPLAAALLFAPIEAYCQDTDASQQDAVLMELVRAGVAQYRDNHPELALAAFNKAWQIKKTPTIAANLGRVELKLGQYRGAAEHWTYYLNQHPADPKEAEDALAECRQHVGSIQVTVNKPGARVSVDDETAGSAPLESDVWVDPGPHAVYAELEGQRSSVQNVNVAAGVIAAVTLDVGNPKPVATPAPHASPSASPVFDTRHEASDSGVKPRTVVLIGGAVLTVAAATTGIVYAVKGNAAYDEAQRINKDIERKTVGTDVRPDGACLNPTAEFSSICGQLRAKIDENDRDRNLAIGSYIVAGVLGAATVATYFLWPESKGHAHVALVPWALPGGRGLQLFLQF